MRKIKIQSFGTKESLDLRNILEGMYRRVGRVLEVSFPDNNTIEMTLESDMDFRYEYGIHEMSRVSPRESDGKPRTSHAMVEIDGMTREEIVASYNFYPNQLAKNYLNGRVDDLFRVLNGNPLGSSINKYQIAYV